MPTRSYIWSEEERENLSEYTNINIFQQSSFLILSPLSIQINMRTIG